MHVILLFVNTVLNQLPQRLRLRPLPLVLYELIFYKGEASILKFYLQDKFPMGNLVIKFSIEWNNHIDRNGILIVLNDEARGLFLLKHGPMWHLFMQFY